MREDVPSRSSRSIPPVMRRATTAVTPCLWLAPAGIPLPKPSRPVSLRGRPSSSGTHRATPAAWRGPPSSRSEEHTSELQSQSNLVCRLLLEKKKTHSIRAAWVLDLFAVAFTLGIEPLSLGAASSTFVDRARCCAYTLADRTAATTLALSGAV